MPNVHSKHLHAPTQAKRGPTDSIASHQATRPRLIISRFVTSISPLLEAPLQTVVWERRLQAVISATPIRSGAIKKQRESIPHVQARCRW